MFKNKSSLAFTVFLISLFIFFDLFSQAPTEENPNAIKELDEGKANPNAGKISKAKDGSLSFTADWRNTEIKDFLKGMSAIIKKNILIDDAIKGKKITIISQNKVNVKDAFSFMKSVLEVQGFALIEETDIVKVVKIKDALAKSPIVRVGRELIPDNELHTSKIITQIVPILQTNAGELEPLLKRVTSPDTDVIVYRTSNTVVLSGSSGDINKLIRVIEKLDQRQEGPGTTVSAGDIHIYTLEYSEAEKLTAVLVKLDNPVTEGPAPIDPTKVGSTPSAPKVEKIKAVAHKDSNSVIITANKSEWDEIQRLIKILDLPRKQVLLEVLIVELTSNDLNDFGIDWRYQKQAYAQFNSGLAQQGGVINNKGQPTNVNTLTGFSLGFLRRGGEQIIAILNANSTNENFNVLSAPQILTVDNQEAEINVGQDVPVRTQSRNAGLGGDNAVTVDNFEYRPTGIKLKFTPHINKNNKLTLDLFQEIKNIAGLPTQGGNPIFNKRDVKTTITVENTQTIVIGGLISNDKQKKITKIPLLGDIPLIGNFFRRTTTQLKKTNLMLFLTPHILDSRSKADKITVEKKVEQEIQEEERERRLR